MAMSKPMTIDKARAIAQQVNIGRTKYGAQYSPQWSAATMAEALSVLEDNGNWDGPTKAELTKANRQLAAANARYERLKGKTDETLIVSGFYEEEYPSYYQGAPTHELQEIVTAEELNGLVAKLRDAQTHLKSLESAADTIVAKDEEVGI